MSKLRDGLVMAAEGLADMLEGVVASSAAPVVPTIAVTTAAAVAEPEAPKTSKKDTKATPSVKEASTTDAAKGTSESLTLRQQCTAAVVAMVKAKGRQAAVDLLKKFGAESVPKLADEKLAEFLKAAV